MSIHPTRTGRSLSEDLELRIASERSDAPLRFEPGDIEALTPSGPYHHKPSGMLYAKAAYYDAAVAEVWHGDRYLRLCLPSRATPPTIAQWNDAAAATATAQHAAANAPSACRPTAGRSPSATFTTSSCRPSPPPSPTSPTSRRSSPWTTAAGCESRSAPRPATSSGCPGPTAPTRSAPPCRVVFAADRTVIAHLHDGVPLPDAHVDPYGEPVE